MIKSSAERFEKTHEIEGLKQCITASQRYLKTKARESTNAGHSEAPVSDNKSGGTKSDEQRRGSTKFDAEDQSRENQEFIEELQRILEGIENCKDEQV